MKHVRFVERFKTTEGRGKNCLDTLFSSSFIRSFGGSVDFVVVFVAGIATVWVWLTVHVSKLSILSIGAIEIKIQFNFQFW